MSNYLFDGIVQSDTPVIQRVVDSTSLHYFQYLNPNQSQPTPHATPTELKRDETQRELADSIGCWRDTTTRQYISKLPTSVTYTLGNELHNISFVEFSDHGAYLAIGMTSGMIKLFCFGRNDQSNEFLSTVQMLYQQLQKGIRTREEVQKIIAYNYDFFGQYDDLDQHGSFLWLLSQGIDARNFVDHYHGKGTTAKLAAAAKDGHENGPPIPTNVAAPLNSITSGEPGAEDDSLVNTSQTGPTAAQQAHRVNINSGSFHSPTYSQHHKPQVHKISFHTRPITGIQFSKCLTFMLAVDTFGQVSMWALTEGYFDAVRHISNITREVKLYQHLYPYFNYAYAPPQKIQDYQSDLLAIHQQQLDHLESKSDQFEQLRADNAHKLDNLTAEEYAKLNAEKAEINMILAPTQPTHPPPGSKAYAPYLLQRYNDHNPPFLITKWSTFPAIMNTMTLSPCYAYFAITHVDLGVSIFRTDLRDPIRMIPRNIPRNLYHEGQAGANMKRHLPSYIQLSPNGHTAWSPNGAYLAVAFHTGHVGVFSPFAQIEGVQPTHPVRLIKCRGEITCLAFSPCGYYLFTADTTLTMTMWLVNLQRGQQALKRWELTPSMISVDMANLILNPQNYIKLTLPIQRVPSYEELFETIDHVEQHPNRLVTVPPPPPQKQTFCFPMTAQGTLHRDIITSCTFSRIASPKKYPQAAEGLGPGQEPYLLSTASLDGTVKIWYPHPFHTYNQDKPQENDPSNQQAGYLACDLRGNLLQTIYYKHPLPVQMVKFTSRNLLLICTSDDDVDKLSAISRAEEY